MNDNINIAQIVRSEHNDNHIGRCYESPDGCFRYVPIPKCGSTSGEDWCNAHAWSRENFVDDRKDTQYLVILRDPWQRWCSAIDMYIRWKNGLNKSWNQINTSHLEVIERTVIMDQHSEKQSTFLHGLRYSQCKFLPLDETLSKKWKEITGKEFPFVHWDPETDKSILGNERKNSNTEWFHKLRYNEKWFNRFKKIYQYDYQIFDKIKTSSKA